MRRSSPSAATTSGPSPSRCRKQYPDARIIVLADDDWKEKGNPGLTKATEAARSRERPAGRAAVRRRSSGRSTPTSTTCTGSPAPTPSRPRSRCQPNHRRLARHRSCPGRGYAKRYSGISGISVSSSVARMDRRNRRGRGRTGRLRGPGVACLRRRCHRLRSNGAGNVVMV